MRLLSGDHDGSLSPAFIAVILRGLALPSEGTTQRSVTASFSLYEGSVTEKTTHLPSGLMEGAPTRFISHSASCVRGCFCANSAAAKRSVRARANVRFSMRRDCIEPRENVGPAHGYQPACSGGSGGLTGEAGT